MYSVPTKRPGYGALFLESAIVHKYRERAIRLMCGLALFSFGLYLTIRAHIGLAPWEAFNMGLTYQTPLSYGTVLALVGVLILVAVHFLGEKIGVGTIANTLLVGVFIDIIHATGAIPQMDNFAFGVAMLLVGQAICCVGTYNYIASALGCGPRDALMVALAKRLPSAPIGAVRGVIEATVLLIGWGLGAKVGAGTVIAVFSIGFILQYTFKFFKFDVKAVRHESVADTIRQLKTS